MPQTEKPLTYTVPQTAQLLGIGRNQGYEAVARREIPSIRIGKRILVPRAAVEGLLASAVTPPKAA